VLQVEYRGYGDSDDAQPPNETGLKLDSEAALNFLRQHPNVDPSQIFIYGQSLGGSVGFHLASYAEKEGIELAGLIVENSFLSIGKMVDEVMPVVSPLKGILLRNRWDSNMIAPALEIPVLYLAGDADEIVPHSHMKELYELSLENSVYARMHIVKGGNHNETWLQGGPQYWEVMLNFIREAEARQIGMAKNRRM